MSKLLFFLFAFFTLFSPTLTHAQEENFTAEVIRVDGDTIQVEDIEGNRHIIDSSIDIGNVREVYEGDKVIVNKIVMEDGTDRFLIVSKVRHGWAIALIVFFVASILFFGKKHGLRSLVTIIVTLGIVIFGIIPLILNGWNPLLATILGTSIAMVFTMYFVYGWNRTAHASLLSIVVSMFGAGLLSWFFIKMLSLSGFVSDEASYLVALGYDNLDMRGLLLSAILIGTLGVLDDVVVSQVSMVKELFAQGKSTTKEVFSAAMRVGRNHMSSMVNTLIFAYTGASFPLMILFALGEPPFDSMSAIINNEIVATELARSLIGSIILLLAVPVSTWIAIRLLVKK